MPTDAVRRDAQPRLEIRRVDPGSDADLDAVVDLHLRLLSFGPAAGLGPAFLREVAYRPMLADGLMHAALARLDGRAVGVVAFTPRAVTFNREVSRRYVGRKAWYAARAIAADPRRLRALAEVVSVAGSRDDEAQRATDPLGEVTVIAVDPACRTADFRRAARIDVADELMAWAARSFHRAGLDSFIAVVDADNRDALLFYAALGASGEPIVRGRRSVRFTLRSADFVDTVHGIDGVPECWAAAPSVDNPVETGGWSGYWEALGDRQRIFRAESRDFAGRLLASGLLHASSRVLDFGCGFGHVAREIGPRVARVGVWDAALSMRRAARLNLLDQPNVVFTDLRHHVAPGDWDAIVVNSVVQYFTRAELLRWLARWRVLLDRPGVLVLSDVPRPDASAAREVGGMLRFAASRGFLGEALVGGAREWARYRSMRTSQPLLALSPEELSSIGAEAGYAVEILPRNLTHRVDRLTAVMRPLPAADT